MHSEKLDAAIAAFLQAQAEGKKPDPQAWFVQYPELAEELRAFFADRAKLEELVAPLRQSEGETTPPTAEWQPSVEPPTLAPGETSPSADRVKIRYFGDYELLEEIARGGMGVVFKARQVSLNRIVALKMILAGQLAGEEEVQRFRTEAEAAANLDHPHIVPIYEVGEHQSQQYFSMKYIDGNSFASLFSHAPQARCSARDLISLLIPVCHAVHHAHQRGILHRDLKPGNILLDKDGQPHVTDFGLAKKVEGDSGMTRTGAIVGTPSYMAPEQAAAKKQLTTAVDVYSLGAILYEILTGRPPFREATPLDTLMKVLDKDPELPRKVNPSTDRDLETICLKCLEKEPEKRYGSAQALAEELERWQKGEPILARPTTRGERLVKWARRKPALAALTAFSVAAVLLLITGLSLGMWLLTRANQRIENSLAEEKEAKEELRNTRDREQQTSYFQRITAAQFAWQGNNLPQMERFLDACPIHLRHWEWHYLNRLCHPGLRTFPRVQHQGSKAPASFSQDGKRLAVRDDDNGCILLCDTATGKTLRTIPVEMDRAILFAFSPDGSLLAVEGDKAVHLYRVSDGVRLRSLPGGPARLYDLDFHPQGQYLAAGGARKSRTEQDPDKETGIVTVWKVADGQEVLNEIIPGQGVYTVQFSSDGQRLLATLPSELMIGQQSKASVQAWTFTSGRSTRAFQFNELVWNPQGSIRTSPNGERLALIGTLNVRVRDGRTGEVLHTLGGQFFRSAAFSPDDQELATVGEFRAPGTYATDQFTKISLWDQAGKEVRNWLVPVGKIHDLQWTPDGKRLIAVCSDTTIRFFNDRTCQQTLLLCGHAHPVVHLVCSPDSRHLLTMDQEGHMRYWDVQANPVAATSPPGIAAWQIRPGGKEVVGAWSGQSCVVQSLELQTGHVISQQEPLVLRAQFLGSHVALSPTAIQLALALEGKPARLEIWDLTTRQMRHSIPLDTETGEIDELLFDTQGQKLAGHLDGREKYLIVWDTRTGQELYRVANVVKPHAFSPGAPLMATLDETATTLQLRDASTGKVTQTIPVAKDYYKSLSFSPDGRTLALAAYPNDGRAPFVILLNWETKKTVKLLGAVGGVAFTADGRRLVTNSAKDARFLVWDAAGGQFIFALGSELGEGQARYSLAPPMAFTEDGHYLVAGSALTKGIQIFDGRPISPSLP